MITARDFDDGVAQMKARLDLACDAIAFLTGNAVELIALILAAADDTFRARFFPPIDRALIHIDERPARMPQIFAAAETSGEIGLAISLLRTGAQARTRDFRIFYYVEALEVLSGLVPGTGSLAEDSEALETRRIQAAAHEHEPEQGLRGRPGRLPQHRRPRQAALR